MIDGVFYFDLAWPMTEEEMDLDALLHPPGPVRECINTEGYRDLDLNIKARSDDR